MPAIIESFQKKSQQLPIFFKNKNGIIIQFDGQKYTKQKPIIKDGKLIGLLREF